MMFDIIMFVCAALVLCFSLSQAWLAWKYLQSKSKYAAKVAKPVWTGSLPRILVQLPVYNEKYVVERLLRAAAQMDYPHNLLCIQLLDDSDDDTTDIAAKVIKEISQKNGPHIVHLRRADRVGYKAGALDYGLKQSTHEFISIFDADFLPKADFLKDVLGYFSNPKLGMVQTRWDHLNEDHSVLTRILGFAIDNHFSVEQGGRQASDCFINFNGTAGMWRRRTIDDAGGWSDDCLTEDLDLSFRAQLNGWEALFVEEIATPSELPTEVNSIRAQQSRWTKGAVETSRKNLSRLWFSKLGLQQKLVGTFHMINSSIFFPAFLIGIITGAWFIYPSAHQGLRSSLLHTVLLVSFVALGFTYWISQTRGDFKLKNDHPLRFVAKYLFFMSVIVGFGIQNSKAVLEGLLGRSTPFVRTPKLNIVGTDKADANSKNYLMGRLPVEFYFEALAAGYFIVLCGFSLFYRSTDFLDIFVFYGFGFCAVVFFSLNDHLRSLRAITKPAIA
jgi:cellulose synthase/poly-beta-1,6-N-acetylglucosamine synthase-like glycosyltransferase